MYLNPLIILAIIVGVAGVIALIAWLLHKFVFIKLKKDDKPTDEEIASDFNKRMLQDIEDENISKQVQNYKDDDE